MQRYLMTDPFDLGRFVSAQKPVYPEVIRELSAGFKQSHWMWFIFPQIAGLGFSAMSKRYAISSRAEAMAYLAHQVLGSRLRECTQLMLDAKGLSARQILGAPDDLKFHSSMTLFAAVSNEPAFAEAITRYFAGVPDQATLEILTALGR
jgi:uncharacterized protein (DUF1810 family)